MKFKLTLIVFFLLIVSVIVTLNIFFYQAYEAEMAAQINQQQLIIAKTIASSMEDTLDHLKEETIALAGLLSERGLKKQGLGGYIQYAIAEIKEEIKIEITIYNEKEELIYSSKPLYKPTVKDMLMIEKARSAGHGKLYFSDRIAEERIVNLATVMNHKGKNLGTVILDMYADDMNKKFLSPIKSGERGYAWIISGDGTLVYHPIKSEMVGKNIYQHDNRCYDCHKSFNTEIQILKSADMGMSAYIAPLGEDKLIAFSRLKSLDWIVCVSIPRTEVTASIKNSMMLQSALVLTIFISTAIGAFFVIIINKERVKAEEKANYADKIKEYADELENIVRERTKELRSEKEKLDAVINSLEAGMCIFNERRECVWMNKVMQGWLSPEIADGLMLDHLFCESALTEDLWSAVIEDRMVQEVQKLDLGNKRGYFQMSVTRFHSPDGSSQLLMLMQDITELKKAEEQLIHSEKLTALSRLSAGVAHEIGNPLTSISSYVQILRDMEFDEFTKGAIETIFKHINRIATILKKMSGFAKSSVEEIRDYDIKELVDTTVDLVKYDKRTKNIEIKVDIPEGTPKIRVDGNQMVQLFINLTLNAADAMSRGGTLLITAEKSNGGVEIVYRDNGHGIPKENLARIFDPFFTTKETGTGLGLSVSYGIVKSFGGDLIVESEPGKGTAFKVRLPASET